VSTLPLVTRNGRKGGGLGGQIKFQDTDFRRTKPHYKLQKRKKSCAVIASFLALCDIIRNIKLKTLCLDCTANDVGVGLDFLKEGQMGGSDDDC